MALVMERAGLFRGRHGLSHGRAWFIQSKACFQLEKFMF
jgi:hypothetical protein